MNKTVKVQNSVHALVSDLAAQLNITASDAIALAVNAFNENATVSKDAKKVSAETKLMGLWEQIQSHNEAQKTTEKKYFPFPSAYMLNKALGINRDRDIKPFIAKYSTLIEKHEKGLKLSVGYKVHPSLLLQNEKKQNVFIIELAKKTGFWK